MIDIPSEQGRVKRPSKEPLICTYQHEQTPMYQYEFAPLYHPEQSPLAQHQ